MKYQNILLVNDINEDAETFVLVLNAINNKIRSSVEGSALEALKKLQHSKLTPDIIFLDYNTLYLDGSVFLKLLRYIKGLKRIPVVLYSRNSGHIIKEVLTEFKGVQFLKKSANYTKLINSMQNKIMAEKD